LSARCLTHPQTALRPSPLTFSAAAPCRMAVQSLSQPTAQVPRIWRGAGADAKHIGFSEDTGGARSMLHFLAVVSELNQKQADPLPIWVGWIGSNPPSRQHHSTGWHLKIYKSVHLTLPSNWAAAVHEPAAAAQRSCSGRGRVMQRVGAGISDGAPAAGDRDEVFVGELGDGAVGGAGGDVVSSSELLHGG
jgi:hypothetical protein